MRSYRILALDPGYRWMLVGEPRRRYAWVLARTPAPDEATLAEVFAKTATLGFDPAALRRTPRNDPLE